jgi:hypothetical protein
MNLIIFQHYKYGANEISSHFAIWAGTLLLRRQGMGNVNFFTQAVGKHTLTDGNGISNSWGMRIRPAIGKAIFDEEGGYDKPKYVDLSPNTNTIQIEGFAYSPRVEDSTKTRGHSLGKLGFVTGTDTLIFNENNNGKFVIQTVPQGELALKETFAISDTANQRWSGEQYISDSSGIAYFDKDGRLERDATAYQLQKSNLIKLSYLPSNSTDFQAELSDRTEVSDGTKLFYHASSSLSYEYIYDKINDNLKRISYSSF